jgi:acyl transferase domain-containing protein
MCEIDRDPGTGTAVGDPTEMKAIGRVFRTSRSHEEPLYV